MKYSISVLREAAVEYFAAKQQLRDHVRNKAKKIADPKICGGEEGWGVWLMRYEGEYSDKYNTLRNMCRLIYADFDTVIAVEKSIRRNAQYQRGFQSEAQFHCWPDDAGGEDSYRRAVTHVEYWERSYESTGRRWNF